MLQQFLVWYLKSAAKVIVWFIKNLGPAMMIAFIPTFAIGTIAVLLFGSTGDSMTGGYLMTAPELTQNIIGISFFGTTVLVYIVGWKIIWEVPKALVGVLSEVVGGVRGYIQR